MSAAIGWYGPLIDLSRAVSHVDDFVQLLVFVHRSRPLPKFKGSRGEALFMTDIQVGDDTRACFSVCVRHKNLGSMIVAGDVILLQNVKIVKYKEKLQAATIQVSSVLVLVHHYESFGSKDLDELIAHCQVGKMTKEKLKKVLEWIKQTESVVQNVQRVHSQPGFEQKRKQPMKNWISHKEKPSRECISISEVCSLSDSCNTRFYACISDILVQFAWRTDEVCKENLFISKRLFMRDNNNIVVDLICTGCKLCGSPLDSRTSSERDKVPLYCQKSSNYVHNVCLIYRPFLLYIWDDSKQIPLIVKNKAAEFLFGNINAEDVYRCYQGKKDEISDDGTGGKQQSRRIKPAACLQYQEKPNFYSIWLILLRLLLQQGNNSPFHFEVSVDGEKDEDDGRFELVSLTMPCRRPDGS